MKKIDLIDLLENELQNLYHNATLSYVSTDSDFEADLLEQSVNERCQYEISDLKYTFPEILEYGKVYQWGRGGRTLAPIDLIRQRGGSSFSIKNVDDLDLDYWSMKKLYKTLKKFNQLVNQFCQNVAKDELERIREMYQDEIKENKDKKRQYYSGVKYV